MRIRRSVPTRRPLRVSASALLAAPGLLFLAWEPARWLFGTWSLEAYASDGEWIALAVAGLMGVSVASGRPQPDAPDGRDRRARIGWSLLAATAVTRMLGRVFAVDTVGAIALVLDVMALGTLAATDRRPFAVHPAPLGLLFAFALPLEHLLQRLLGFPLQWLAAVASEGLLALVIPDVARQGVLLVHPSLELAIDLPCSGARGLVLYGALASGLWSLRRLSTGRIGLAALAVAGGALAANTARVLALFLGTFHGLPVLAEPWHAAIGAASLGLGALPWLAVFAAAPPRRCGTDSPRGLPFVLPQRTEASRIGRAQIGRALALAVAALAVAFTPERPVDASAPIESQPLPVTLGERRSRDEPLRADERRFFTQWGGGAQKRRYSEPDGADRTVLVVSTRSPLRHMHGPDRCLLGAGHRVTRIGVSAGLLPTVIYRSVAPDGTAWRVEASFASDRGDTASSVSQVVWRWLARPDATWSLVERITPWELCEARPESCQAFDRDLFASLDLGVAAPTAEPGPTVGVAVAALAPPDFQRPSPSPTRNQP